MDLYNLFVSGEKIYKQIKKSPRELTYEDYLLMMDPFFISENDIIDVEKMDKLKGGSSDDEFGEDLSSLSSLSQSLESGDSSESKKDKSNFLSKFFKKNEMSEKDIKDELEGSDSEQLSPEEQEIKDEMKKDKKNALKNFKSGTGKFLKYFILLLFIGGGPLFIWFFIMYHTFKRMKSTYKWMIEPM
jgi:hypothetical protein